MIHHERVAGDAANMIRLTLIAALVITSAASALAADARRPNVVVVLVDDLRWDELGYAGHPYVKTPHVDRLAAAGAVFTNAFCTTPLCSPSRASFLTGHYAHRHGIIDNTDRSAASHQLVTFPRLLHDDGYETAYIGKWHMGVDDSPRPGFDDWLSLKGQGQYIDPDVNDNGRPRKITGYATDIFNARAVEFIRRPRDKPFLVYLSHKAVHPNLTQRADGSIDDPLAGIFVPAERHRSLYADAAVPRRPNALAGPKGKPALERQIGDLPPLSLQTRSDDESIRNRQRMFAAIDDGVGDVWNALSETGQRDDTIFIFTSDHGYISGEHGLSVERRLAYEETSRIPLVMAYPRLVKPGSKIEPLVLSIDLLPTVMELCGAKAPEGLHGRSLVPLLKGESPPWRDSILVEYFSDRVFPRMLNMGYQAVRTHRHKYIRYTDLEGMDELYDLDADPFEMNNLVAEPGQSAILAKMKTELDRLIQETP